MKNTRRRREAGGTASGRLNVFSVLPSHMTASSTDHLGHHKVQGIVTGKVGHDMMCATPSGSWRRTLSSWPNTQLCTLWSHWSDPSPQPRTAGTPPPVNVRTELGLQSNLRDNPRVGVVTGRKLTDQLRATNWLVLRKRIGPTMRFGSLPLPGNQTRVHVCLCSWKERTETRIPRTLNPWAWVGNSWFPRCTIASGSTACAALDLQRAPCVARG